MNLDFYIILLGTFGIETVIMLTVVTFNYFRILLFRGKIQHRILIGLQFIFEYLSLQNFLWLLRQHYWLEQALHGYGCEFMMVLQTFLTIIVLQVTAFVHKAEKKSLTKNSLKNGLDTLPGGLLFYWSGGVVKMVNSKMDEISHVLFREGIYNGNIFWDKIKERALDRSLQKDKDVYMIRLNDGKVYSFKRSICYFEDHELYEVTAYDVSREQLLNEELKIKRVKADEIKNRLRQLNDDIEQLTSEKEMLDTKRKVHDDLGKTLIMTRRYLETKDEELGKEIIKLWKLNTMLLKGEESETDTFQYSGVVHDIRKSGLEVSIEGTLPTDKNSKEVVIAALRTCATNTLRHGTGTEMYVNISKVKVKTIRSLKEKDYVKIEISNNGKVPEGEFTEGGGLTNLRRSVERINGLMNIEITDRFKVVLKLPKQTETQERW
ncbi:MAG: hypothetical protein IKS98_05185 [Lachnospiraceae bacterium]|nr:hypothetical protein [Lachnospiraceae bacterium]